MKFNKKSLLVPSIIILPILLLFSEKIIDLIPSNRIISVTIIIYLLGFSIFVFLTYRDITRKKYTTNTYIVLIDILVIIFFLTTSFTAFINYTETDFLVRAERNLNISKAYLFFFLALLARSLLMGEQFRRS